MSGTQEEPLSLDPVDEPQPVPVPVPPPAAGGEGEPKPVPVPVPVAKKDVTDEPIQLDEFEDDDDSPTQRRTFGAGAGQTVGFDVKTEFRRKLNLDGSGATRCKMFHSKIADAPLKHVESMINEWADENDVEIKFVTQTIGVLEGKRAEPNLLMFVWY